MQQIRETVERSKELCSRKGSFLASRKGLLRTVATYAKLKTK